VTIERAARYARDRAESLGAETSFHMTTNGTLLTPDVAAMLHELGVRVLVSVDGHEDYHDAHRPFPGGGGSYETINRNLRGLPEDMRPGARATVTEDSAPLADLVRHLANLGFRVVHLAPVSGAPMTRAFADRLIREYEDLAHAELAAMRAGRAPTAGCFVEPVLSLELGRERLVPCGAGARYVSVDHDGGLYLCHRFAGNARYGVGDVRSGFDRHAAGALLHSFSRRSSACGSCWAYGLCGGPCMHDVECGDGASVGPSAPRCRVTQRVLELSMWLYASLPEESRVKLTRAARADARPEMAVAGRERAAPGREMDGVSVGSGGTVVGLNRDEGR
jgi:uncharacterized protein